MTTTTVTDPFDQLPIEHVDELRRMRSEAVDAAIEADSIEAQATRARKLANQLLKKYERRLAKLSGELVLFD
jgi:predicted ribosome quality control (RQC) complex YloA/Tae2 family protein